jgi:hypothetical protein
LLIAVSPELGVKAVSGVVPPTWQNGVVGLVAVFDIVKSVAIGYVVSGTLGHAEKPAVTV